MTRIKPLKAKADKLFSLWVRRGGKCERCGKTAPNVQLQCSHIMSRKFNATRFEPINAICLCASCHRLFHDRPPIGVEWEKEYLGEAVYEELKHIAKTRVVKSNDAFYEDIISKLKNKEKPYGI